MAIENFIQYIDDTYAVKYKEVENVSFGDDGTVTIKGISSYYFPLAVYSFNKRVKVNSLSIENMSCMALLNDFGNVDLNTIPLNVFYPPESELQVSYYGWDENLNVNVQNFPAVTPVKFYKEYPCPIYRPNVYNFTNQSLGGEWSNTHWIVQNVFRKNSDGSFVHFSKSSFDNFNGSGAMPTDYDWNGLFDMSQVFMLNGMYVRMTINTPSALNQFIQIRFFQDIRTNEVYITFATGAQQTTYLKFLYQNLEIVSGGFVIRDFTHGITIEVNKDHFV